jgi:hydrogenase maturation protease
MSRHPGKVLIIGVGNSYRGDDGAGLAVARELAGQVPAEIQVVEQGGEGTALMEAWKGARVVVLVDAIQSGAPAGTIRRLDAVQENIPPEIFRASTHGFGLSRAIELGRTLNELPPHLVVYGIEGQNFAPGEKLSPAVEKAIAQAAAQVLFEARRPTAQ